MSKIKLLLDVVEDMRSLADSIQAVADAMTQSEAQPDTAPKAAETPVPKTKAETKITIEEVRAVLISLSQDGYGEQIRAIFKRYGAEKLSGVAGSDYAAVIQDAEELKNAT